MATFDGSDDLGMEETPTYDRMDKEYKIYVSNLPEELNEGAVREIFNSYGKITGMFYRATWAYITYGTYREAELAIRELNNKKPLYMKVVLAKDKPAVNETFQRFCISETEEKPDKKLIYVHEKPSTSYSVGRGNTIGRYLPSPGNVKSHRLVQDEGRIQGFPLSAASSVYGSDELYASTSRLWTRGLVTVTEDGRRHVTLGRGFTKYEIPEPHPKIEEYITKVYESRQNGLYEYSDDKLKNELQICIVCSARAMKRCEKCLTYYCSKACQITHWPRHQVECERIPDLVDETPPAQIDTNTNESTKPNLVNTHVSTPSDEVKLRRPNTPVKIQGLTTNTQRNLITKTNEDAVPTNKPSSVQFETNNNIPTEKKVDQPAVNAANRTQPISSRLHKYNSNENVDQSKRNDQFLPAPNHTRSNYNRGYKNDVTSKPTSDRETNKNGNVRDKFNRDDRSYPHQRDEFQNGRRSSYNHKDTANKQGQRVSMQSMDAEKTMAVEMEERSGSLAARTTKNFSQSGNVNNVTPKAPQETPSSSSPNTRRLPSIQLPNLLDAIDNLLIENAVPELEVEGGIEFTNRVEKNVYLGFLVLHQHAENLSKVLDDLSAVCINMKEAAANYRPQVGDLICGEIKTDTWRRGYVMALSPDLLMAVVDEAKTVPVTKIVPCPKELLNICTFGVICEVNNTELQENMYIINAVINKHNKKQGSFKAKLLIYNENNEVTTSIEAVIKPWEPAVPKSAPISRLIPALVELKNGDKANLVFYRNHFTLFVHSLDQAKVEYTNNILQRVAHCSQTAPRLSKPPHVEQMVIAPYHNDDNNYRAMITEIQGNKAKVVYVDYGNLEDINVSELQEIPDDLAIQPSCVAKLTLKDVPQNVPMTQQADSYLRTLLSKPEPFICTCNDKSDGWYLTTSAGERINDKIKQLLIPSWKKENNADNTCYMLNDIETASLGKVGDIVDACVLYRQKNQYLFMSPFETDLIQHVTQVMPELMKEYCEKTEFYVPRKQELCLALYEGNWYRAVCLVPKLAQGISEILFLDYGNIEEVEHINVRLMPESFIKPQALANPCMIVNLAPVDSKGKYSDAVNKKLSELVRDVIKIKIVEYVDDEYKVELPELRAVLVKENLVPPSF